MTVIAFVQPRTVEEAVEALDKYGNDARPIAGATTLTMQLHDRIIHPKALISLNGVDGLNHIGRQNGSLSIGALVTHRQIETSPVIREALPALATTFARVANVRVRNVATVGGVLAAGEYASDPPAAFLALDALVEVAGPGGARTIAIADFFRDAGRTALASNEIIVRVEVPILRTGTAAVYEKFVTHAAKDRPCVGVFAAVRLADDTTTCAELRVAVGAASEVPRRFADLEASAHERSLDDNLVRAIADGYAQRILTITDVRASAWYRTEMIRVWVGRAIERALASES